MLEENLQLFNPEGDVSSGLVTYGLFYAEGCSLYNHFLEFLSGSGYWVLSAAFSTPLEMIIVFILQFVNVLLNTDLQILNNAYILEINPIWSRCIILLVYYWTWFGIILFRIFASSFFFFCIYVNQWYWPIIFFFVVYLSGFGLG